jgi:hypothetical protein
MAVQVTVSIGKRTSGRFAGETKPPDTETPMARSASYLISGTVVPLAGSGLSLTSPFPYRKLIGQFEPDPASGIKLTAPSQERRVIARSAGRLTWLKIGIASEPLVARRRTSKRRRIGSRPLGPHDVISSFSRDRKPQHVVLFDKVKAIHPQGGVASLRLTGRPGSASPPSKEYYDLELDEYQTD